MSDDLNKPLTGMTGEQTLALAQLVRGGVVYSVDVAAKIAEVLCEAHHGADEVALQRPFTITDNGTYWRIEGSRNRDRKVTGPGPFVVSIEKRDGRVSEIRQWFINRIDQSVIDEVEPFLSPALKDILLRLKARDE